MQLFLHSFIFFFYKCHIVISFFLFFMHSRFTHKSDILLQQEKKRDQGKIIIKNTFGSFDARYDLYNISGCLYFSCKFFEFHSWHKKRKKQKNKSTYKKMFCLFFLFWRKDEFKKMCYMHV